MKSLWRSPQFFIIGLLSLLSLSPTLAQTPRQLTGCASQTPPFVMMKDGIGSSGYSVDFFNAVAKSMALTGEIRELPWARCLRDVAEGQIDVAVDAYDDAERRTKYLYSTPYYTLTPQVFFTSRAAGKGLPVKSARELAALKGCGIHEYTYEHYGLDAKLMDRGAKSDKALFLMLLAERCDYAVEELEYIIGARKHRSDWPDESTLHAYRPDWAKAPQLHYLIGRKHADATKLHSTLNLAIDRLEKSGEAYALRTAYFPHLASKPSDKKQ